MLKNWVGIWLDLTAREAAADREERRSHERPERLIEAIVRRRDDGFVETAIGFDGVVVTGFRLPHEAVSLANSRKLSCVRLPRCEGGRRRLEAQPEFEELELKQGVGADAVERLVARFGLPLVIKPLRIDLPPLEIWAHWYWRMNHNPGHRWLREALARLYG